MPGLAGIRQLITSGGGVRNGHLMARIRARLPALEVVLSDVHGIPAQFKEAVKFATLAYANVQQLANNIPAASGASGFTILGKTVQAPRRAKVMG